MLVPRDDVSLQQAIKRWPSAVPPGLDPVALLRRAEYHGLAGVVSDSLVAAGVAVEPRVLFREAAREADHAAHLDVLRTIDAAFTVAGVDAAILKGALFAERYYPRPSARVTGDTDVLIREGDLEAARGALRSIGYVAGDAPDEEVRLRREHFHLHFRHPQALPLELHFVAYRGFGGVLRADALLTRSHPYRDCRALRVLDPADELVYLAVHAAAHKFGRWSWLFDLRLLIDRLDAASIRAAATRAQELGFARPVALAARLLTTIMGVERDRLRPLGRVGLVRGPLAERLLVMPAHPIASAASRFVYTTALCPDAVTSLKWAAGEILRQGRSIVIPGR